MDMEYRRMGKSGLQLSVFSLGSWLTFGKQVDTANSDKLMSFAYEHGVNFFDNAEVYGHGASEEMMGCVLKDKQWERSSYIISSKVFFGTHGSKFNKPNQFGLSRKHVVEACHEALHRYQVDYLDLYLCHRPDKNVPIMEVVRTMNTLIQQGKILYWGTSEWSASEIMEAHAAAAQLSLEGPVVEQSKYNMFSREKIESEFLPIFRGYGLGLTTFSPLESGILTGKYNDKIPADSRLGLESFGWLKSRDLTEEKINIVRRLMPIAEKLNISMATLALAWIIRNPNVTSTILGATKESQLEENLKAVEAYQKLIPEIIEEIEVILDNRPVLDKKL